MFNANIVKAWTFILYPESACKDWKLGLESTRKGFCVSPLHNRDTNEDGTLKKAHYHVVVVAPRGMSYQTALKISSMLGGVRPEPVISNVGLADYLTHKNDADKAQYSEDDILWGNGLSMEQFVNDEKCTLSDVFTFIRDNGIFEYADLIDLFIESEMTDYVQIAVEKAFAIQTYLRSSKFKAKGE